MSSSGQAPELESLRLQVAELSRKLAAQDQSMQVQHQSFTHVMQDLRAQSDLLKAIMEGTAADTGDEFFASLATHLTASLHMQYAVIGEIVDGTPVTIRTVAVASGGALLANFEYDLTQAPCGTALTESFWCYEQGVQALFPDFPPLVALGVDSHSGVSIRNKRGDVVGLIVVMDTKPITSHERLQSLLTVFAPRVAAELQRKHIETALQEQTQRLAHAQALAHLGSWDWEIGSGRMEWSAEQFRIFGYEPGAALTTHETFLAALLLDDHERVLAAMNATLVDRAPFDLECRILRPNGEVRVIHARGEVHRDGTGHPIGMDGTVLDITERKQVEDALRASEARWQLAVRGSNDGIWDWNIQTGDVFFSARWKEMRGYEAHELACVLDEWRSRIHPDDLDRVLQGLDQYLAKQNTEFCQEYRVQRKDGSYMWVFDRGVAQWADDGTPLRMAGSESDITERKQAEEALRESEACSRSIVETALDAVIAIDQAGRVIGWNPQAEAMFGYTAQEAIGRGLSETIIPVQFRQAHAAGVQRVFQNGENPRMNRRLEFSALHRDGHGIPVEFAMALTHVGGQPVLSAFVRDITERKWAEQTLRRSERDLRTILDALPVGVWCTDATGKVRLTNPAGRRIWADVQQVGLEGTEGHPGWWERVGSSGEPHRWALARALTKGEATLNEELTIQCLDGTSKAIINSAVPLFGENGRVSGAIIVNQDITERKALERDRIQTQAFLQSILENIPHIITVKDAKTLKIVQMNRAAEQVLGLNRHLLTDKTLYDCLPEGEADALWAADMEALQRRTLVEVLEHTMKRQGECDRVFWTKKVPILDGEGESQYLLTISEDITERKRAEDALRQSHAFIRQIVDATPNFIFAKDREGRFTLVNKAVADAYGTTVDFLTGKTDADFNSNREEVEYFRQTDLDVMDSLQERFLPEEHITDSAGRTRWLQTVKRPILDEQGRAIMVLGAATDITDRKRIEEALRQREQDLRVAIEERERISQDLHDGILQSLFAVGLGLEAAKSTRSLWSRAKADAVLDQAIDQLNRVIREIRGFIEGLGSDPFQGKDLPTALRNMVTSLTQNQLMHVRLAIEDRASRAVSPDHALHVFHVIQESVSNCIRHGRAQEATVSLKMFKQGIRLSIRDNGRGFNPEVAKGAGHGLINMAARAQKIGGRFTVFSKINKGTRVVFDLPKEASHVRHED